MLVKRTAYIHVYRLLYYARCNAPGNYHDANTGARLLKAVAQLTDGFQVCTDTAFPRTNETLHKIGELK